MVLKHIVLFMLHHKLIGHCTVQEKQTKARLDKVYRNWFTLAASGNELVILLVAVIRESQDTPSGYYHIWSRHIVPHNGQHCYSSIVYDRPTSQTLTGNLFVITSLKQVPTLQHDEIIMLASNNNNRAFTKHSN